MAAAVIWLRSVGAGALVPLPVAATAVTLPAAAASGGHAMLVRADSALRTRTPAFHPQAAPVAALEARVRRAFDPTGVFETGRFGETDLER